MHETNCPMTVSNRSDSAGLAARKLADSAGLAARKLADSAAWAARKLADSASRITASSTGHSAVNQAMAASKSARSVRLTPDASGASSIG